MVRLVVAYLGSIVAGVALVRWVGIIPVWPGIEAPAAVLAIGFTLVFRDLLQKRIGSKRTLALMVVGIVLSLLISPAFALASGAAFAASELVDFGVFTGAVPVVGTIAAVVVSNAVSIVVDSLVFLPLAFGSLEFLNGQIIGKAWATAFGVAVLLALKLRESRQAVTA